MGPCVAGLTLAGLLAGCQTASPTGDSTVHARAGRHAAPSTLRLALEGATLSAASMHLEGHYGGLLETAVSLPPAPRVLPAPLEITPQPSLDLLEASGLEARTERRENLALTVDLAGLSLFYQPPGGNAVGHSSYAGLRFPLTLRLSAGIAFDWVERLDPDRSRFSDAEGTFVFLSVSF